MAAITMKICNDRAAVAWRHVPGEQRQPVARLQRNFADAERSEIPELGACVVWKVEQMALKDVESADQHPIGSERRSEERIQHAA
jgi:hypothetical protein